MSQEAPVGVIQDTRQRVGSLFGWRTPKPDVPEVKCNAKENGVAHPTVHEQKQTKFDKILEDDAAKMSQVQELAWCGIPPASRPKYWMLLMGHLPCNKSRREADLTRKREEYAGYVRQYYNTDSRITEDGDFVNANSGAIAGDELGMRRQIHIDVPRTNPEVPLFHTPYIQTALERILYVWSVRHPASGYVQGLNDLVTPFLTVFLQPWIPDPTYMSAEAVEGILAKMTDDEKMQVEANTFWCFSRLLDSIQDHYTFAQPGIQLMIHKLKDLMARIDGPLHCHLEAAGVDYIQFAFRWMNCLLLREFPLQMSIRLWDTYLAEGDKFPTLHVYVCAALLENWKSQLLESDFTELMLLLQALPTHALKQQDMAALISQAWMWREQYENSPNHLKS